MLAQWEDAMWEKKLLEQMVKELQQKLEDREKTFERFRDKLTKEMRERDDLLRKMNERSQMLEVCLVWVWAWFTPASQGLPAWMGVEGRKPHRVALGGPARARQKASGVPSPLSPLLGGDHVPPPLCPCALDAPASPSECPQDPGLPSPYPHLDRHLPALETSSTPWLWARTSRCRRLSSVQPRCP